MAAFLPVTLEGELSFDHPHHTILHLPRVVSHPLLLMLALQLFPPVSTRDQNDAQNGSLVQPNPFPFCLVERL